LMPSYQACPGAGGSGLLLTSVTDQNVVQGVGSKVTINNLNGIRYLVADYQWDKTPSDDLSFAGAKTINITGCPKGVSG
jgi:hypothetical protein